MKVFAAILLFSILFYGCGEHKSDFISLKRNSGFYRIVTQGNGVFAKENQYILYSLLFIDNKGKVFLDKRQSEQLLKEQVKRQFFNAKYFSGFRVTSNACSRRQCYPENTIKRG